MNRFSWDETRRYWESQASRRATVDFDADPDGLGNVCHPGAPRWFNAYYDHFQRRTFDRLMAAIPAPAAGAEALDVGCGAGRWSAALAARRYRVTGVDLQPSLVEHCRRRLPGHVFECVALQDLEPVRRFDLATSVTVIQHAPRQAQEAMVARLSELVVPGGHALLLENIADQAAHVFSRRIEDWVALFARSGFGLTRLRRYDYSPLNRTVDGLAGWRDARRAVAGPHGGAVVPEQVGVARWGGPARLARRVAVGVDYPIETALTAMHPPLPSNHCGFLFRRRPLT
jgi:2-polyprenyl-3-methyl-5-hydroxy-6-metoxy-1,4-benzoquinol methylase